MNSDTSGVAFSRHPLKPLTEGSVLIEAVYGLGEGLVSGELEADSYEVSSVNAKFIYSLVNINRLAGMITR